ncbi:MAG: hypothetical protein HOP21_01375 [Methylotenera sp.]|nr:hypothetical protein [Methylotenera sp.]
MRSLLLALLAVCTLFILGCASNGAMPSAQNDDGGGGLPEIAAYDDEPFEPLPDFVAAE